MAYNQYREWDKGKDVWNQDSSWNDPKTNIRSRDDDYFGDGKRRKFNNGGNQGYDATHPHDENAYGGGSHTQQYRRTDLSQDFSQEERPRAGGLGKKRLQPSEPSPHVIFLGLDPDFTEADLQAYLTSNGCTIETVTIIRERSTGASKGFGFAQFPTTEHARAFVDPLFPFIQVPPPASHGASATAAFYKALETGLPHNGRRVKIDYSQSATPHDKSRNSRQNLNDGTRDIGNSQGPVLLFRGLDPLSGPQAIHQAMRYSSGPGKEGAKGMKRIILIKDKLTLASFCFAFVEFVDVQSAANVLAATMSPQIHPSGFRISDKPVAASFAHPYSFQLTDPMLRDEAAIPSSTSLGGMEGAWVRYWDETSTIAVLEFKVEEPAKTAQPSSAPVAKEKKEKRKSKNDVQTLLATSTVGPSNLPISDKPVTLSFNKGPTKPCGTTVARPLALGFSLEDTNAEGSGDAPEDTTNIGDSKLAAAKKVAPLIASKKTVSNINKWNQVQEELSQNVTPTISATLSNPSTASSGPEAHSTSPTPAEPSVPPETEFEFSDATAMTCLLCARQFKSLDQLKRHNKESDLHKKNYKDANLREVARQKAQARQTSGKSNEQPKYRDRASERRTLFNQPEAPVLEKDANKPGKKKFAEGPPPPPSPPPPPVNPGQDENNVGNKLLKMMGWKEGTGLGTSADGRVDPIPTAIYAQGVGLGASKGKEIGKYTEGYSGYVHMAQDAARERYGS